MPSSEPSPDFRHPGSSDRVGAAETPQADGFWVHLGADVLNPSVLPAVDGPDPGGLLPDELVALPGPWLASPRCVGLNVTIYAPDLGSDGAGCAVVVGFA